MVRGLPSLRRGGDDHVLVQSPTSQEEQEKRLSIVKKPFQCFSGGRHSSLDDDEYSSPHVTSPEEQYIPPGEDLEYGFEATLQEGKKKKLTKSRSFRKSKENKNVLTPESSLDGNNEATWPEGKKKKLTKSRSFRKNKEKKDAVTPSDSSLDRAIEKASAPYALPGSRSFEDFPPGTDLNSLALTTSTRTRSFASSIPPGKKNDPMDHESIRDVSKALREMERKLEAAGAEGKKVSRTKVMKALLTVVDQLDEQQVLGTSSHDLPPSASLSHNSSAELYRTWTGPSPNTSANMSADQDAIALDRHRRNLEQMRELTITPNKDYSGRAESPWKGDTPSFSKITEELKAATTEETEAVEPDYISSSSDEEVQEEETLFSEETEESNGRRSKNKPRANQKGSFAHAVYEEDTSTAFFSEDTPAFRELKMAEKVRGKSQKGSFAHAVSPSAARSASPVNMFNLDMRDPAVQDALSDLLWIQSPTKSIEGRPKAPVVSPETQSSSNGHDAGHDDPVLHKMRNESESMLSFQSEQEYYDKPDLESATSTTQESFSIASSQFQQQQQQQKNGGRENSWWKRRNRGILKPSSKDTPVQQQQQQDQQPRQLETKVTVTSYDDNDEDLWRNDTRWQEH